MAAFTDCEAKLLKYVAENPILGSITTICRKAGVDRGIYYTAIKKDEFRKAWDEIPRAMVRSYVPGAVSALGNSAIKGDVQAAKVILEMGGVYEQVMRVKDDYADLTDEQIRERKLRLLERLGSNGGSGSASGGGGTAPA